jgi:septal ring-binding cell division protein DamX
MTGSQKVILLFGQKRKENKKGKKEMKKIPNKQKWYVLVYALMCLLI